MNTIAILKGNNGQPAAGTETVGERTPRLDPAPLSIVRLEPVAESIDFIYQFFDHPDMDSTAADGFSGGSFIYNFTTGFLNGVNICYVPVIDDRTPIGMFYGAWLGSDRLDVHQGVFKTYRNLGVRIVAETVNRCWSDFPRLRRMVGHIPVESRQALFMALRGGFRKIGIMPGHFPFNGQYEDAYIVVRDRDGQTTHTG